jgi:hypothetical protein
MCQVLMVVLMTRTMMMMMMVIMMMMTTTTTTTTRVTKITTSISFKAQISTTNKSYWETKMHLFHYNENR